MRMYIVQPGDTIEQISNSFGVPIDVILHTNNIDLSDALVPGVILYI